jgi:hypothetical protein
MAAWLALIWRWFNAVSLFTLSGLRASLRTGRKQALKPQWGQYTVSWEYLPVFYCRFA